MQFDSPEKGWTPAHDGDLRLHSPWALAIALALIALTSAALIAAPASTEKPPPAIAGILP